MPNKICTACVSFNKCYLIPALVDFILRVSVEEGTDIDSLSDADYTQYVSTMLDELQEYNHAGILVHNPVHEHVKSVMVKGAILPKFVLPKYVTDIDPATVKRHRVNGG